jgi:RNA polymerase sigma-70 factor, ECF subfamily
VSRFAGDDVKGQRSTESRSGDAELVRAACAGRRNAFDELVERYQRRAVSVGYRLLGNLHDALEVTQEAFIRAYKNLDALEDGNRFGSWFLRIVTNLSLNFRRDRAVGGRKISLDDCILDEESSAAERIAEPEYSDTRPGAVMAATELQGIVQTAIAALPQQQRTALVLFSIEQMPQKGVAEIMDCSVEAVKWHVFQARKKLKEELADYL